MKLLGWRQELRHDGWVFTSPRGDARIRLSDGGAPLRTAGDLLADAVAELGGEVVVHGRERHTNGEGERYALATLSSSARAGVLAVVYGDTWYRRIWAIGAVEGAGVLRAAVVTLAENGSLGLGATRVRRPWYTPPAGWHGIAHGAVTDWLAPAFPRDPAIITVFPAWPLEVAAIERGIVEVAIAGEVMRERPLAFAGLEGHLRELRACHGGEVMVFHDAELSDGCYGYRARLESRPDTAELHGACLRRLLASLEPQTRAQRHDVLAHWAV